MDSKSICEILKASKGMGLSEIKFKGVVLKFDNLTKPDKPMNNSNITVPIDSNSKFVEQTSFLEDEQEKKEALEVHDEFISAALMASDPEEFEKYQRNL
jgi:hypothetical protein